MLNLDIENIRKDFPILSQKVHNKDLVYFDNGATTQKPQCVLDVITRYYNKVNSSIHRGVHYLSQKATEDYEDARRVIQKFINAEFSSEVVFTSGATNSINLVAFSFGEKYVGEGDEIIISEMEHHANIVPWQMLCDRKKAKLKVIPVFDDGSLDMVTYASLLNERTKIVAVTYASNVLGTVNPIREIIKLAHQKQIPVLIDGAQAIQHAPIDVQALGCDFFVFSGHKVYGPTGIGALYAKMHWLNEMPPYMGGGDMVDCVTFDQTTYNELPFKFEAGTTNYIGAVAMAEGIRYIEKIGIQNIADYEAELAQYATEKLSAIDGLKIYGTCTPKTAVFSFLLEGIHPLDAGMVLDKLGIAIRTGTHCAQPLMQRFGIDGTMRASLSFYNTKAEVDALVDGLLKIKQMFL